MMFQNVGHRPRTQQRVRLGATPDGKLVALMHDSLNHTSMLDDYSEGCSEATGYSYSVPNLRATSAIVRTECGDAYVDARAGCGAGTVCARSRRWMSWRLR